MSDFIKPTTTSPARSTKWVFEDDEPIDHPQQQALVVLNEHANRQQPQHLLQEKPNIDNSVSTTHDDFDITRTIVSETEEEEVNLNRQDDIIKAKKQRHRKKKSIDKDQDYLPPSISNAKPYAKQSK